MTRCERLFRPGLLLTVLIAFGCRQNVDPPPDTDLRPTEPKKTEVLGYAAEDLSSISSYLPVLDEGRLEVAPPIQWRLASRSREYVARFYFDRNRQLPLPRITIHAQNVEEGEPENLTKKNLVDYIKTMESQMDEKELSAVDGKVEPLMLGDVPIARYVTKRSFQLGERLIRAEREVMRTIRGGRVYTLFLDVNAGTFIEYRADAYAVIAAMRFPLAEEEETPDANESRDTGEDGQQR